MQDIPEGINDESIKLYRVGQLDITNQIECEGESKTFEDAIKEAYVKSIETNYTLSICKENSCLNDSEIEF
jgi:hypothetical protein